MGQGLKGNSGREVEEARRLWLEGEEEGGGGAAGRVLRRV